jgi:hypothetical protein
MKKLIGLSLVVALVGIGCFLLFSCRNPEFPPGYVPVGRTTQCKKGDLRFEAPTFFLGKHYFSGGPQVYNSGKGLSVNIDALTAPTGLIFSGSGTIVNSPPHPFGNGQMIQLSVSVLNFDLRQGTRNAEFEYLDCGGTINLGARYGLSKGYIGNMSKMPTSMVINGVTVTKSNVTDVFGPVGVKVAEKGTITLTYSSDIGGMLIGGSEMFLDNFCFN